MEGRLFTPWDGAAMLMVGGGGLNFGGEIEIITKFSALYPKDRTTASLMFSAGKNVNVTTSRTAILECEYCKRF